jgi:uncharacterized SAM-binding protein YcdF (DUF218 family)
VSPTPNPAVSIIRTAIARFAPSPAGQGCNPVTIRLGISTWASHPERPKCGGPFSVSTTGAGDTHPAAVCIVSGGQGKNEPVTEASVMKNYLVSKGIDPSRIAEEPNSYDTKENMTKSAGIMKTRYAGTQMTAVIVTSGFHIFRSVKLAEYSGIKAYGIPAPTPWYIAINDYMREYIGIIKLYVLDLN